MKLWIWQVLLIGRIHFFILEVSGILFHFNLILNRHYSVDPSQTLRPAASDLGLHFLPRSQK